MYLIFEENINKELSEQLPFLATTQILMACVKAGMGREVAHEMIKKYGKNEAEKIIQYSY